MDQQEQGPDQREQLGRIRRSKEDWEQLACRVLLLVPDYAIHLRDNFNWHRNQYDPVYAKFSKRVMGALGIDGTCARSTFSNGVAMALRRMRKQARLAREDFNWSDTK